MMIIALLISCASLGPSYTVQYLEGERATKKFTDSLSSLNIPYKITKHQENIYEVDYREKNENKN